MLGTTFANRYRILAALGEGASSDVFRALDTHQNLDVALKLFRPGTETIHVYGEASILTALEGEHVLRVFNADTYSDIPYIATRIAANGTAEDFRRANPLGLPPDLVLTWVRQALVGLGACHDRGLLHRDVKPDNIFLESPEFALLGDFERAHVMDASGQAPAEGSPFLIAPEMWSVGYGTAASDIYSMGVTAYRLLTGVWPFNASTRAEIEPLVRRGEYVRVRDLAPHVSRRLADRVEKAMELVPSDRYRNWREMHDDLGRSGLIERVWRRRRDHAEHDRCWIETQATRGGIHEVCVAAADHQTFDIEVRHADSKRRVANASRQRVSSRRILVELRSVFDTV